MIPHESAHARNFVLENGSPLSVRSTRGCVPFETITSMSSSISSAAVVRGTYRSRKLFSAAAII